MISARFENEASPCKNQEGRLNPRTKTLKISWFVQHRETIQLQIRIVSPNVERKKKEENIRVDITLTNWSFGRVRAG